MVTALQGPVLPVERQGLGTVGGNRTRIACLEGRYLRPFGHYRLVWREGDDPSTSCLASRRSTAELPPQEITLRTH